MIPELDNYDWKEVFYYAPRGITRDDVASAIAMDDGSNDGEDWVGLFRLHTGDFLTIRAGCDYTGWD